MENISGSFLNKEWIKTCVGELALTCDVCRLELPDFVLEVGVAIIILLPTCLRGHSYCVTIATYMINRKEHIV